MQSPIQGKTYSLFGNREATDHYYSHIKKLTDQFLKQFPDEKELLLHIQKAGGTRSFIRKISAHSFEKSLISSIRKTLKGSLSVYTSGVKQHLKTLPFSKKFDSILRTSEEQYHLCMIEIELMNRINRKAFITCEYKFALIAHCLRDFRPNCKAVPGDIEEVCKGCTRECFINLGSALLKKYNIQPYISATIDMDKLFKKIKSEHQDAGALGIACVPELAHGMRLCMKLGIPAIGIPLDANRCSRWMGKAHESSYNLKELEELIM